MNICGGQIAFTSALPIFGWKWLRKNNCLSLIYVRSTVCAFFSLLACSHQLISLHRTLRLPFLSMFVSDLRITEAHDKMIYFGQPQTISIIVKQWTVNSEQWTVNMEQCGTAYASKMYLLHSMHCIIKSKHSDNRLAGICNKIKFEISISIKSQFSMKYFENWKCWNS